MSKVLMLVLAATLAACSKPVADPVAEAEAKSLRESAHESCMSIVHNAQYRPGVNKKDIDELRESCNRAFTS